jgi:hypothetical protein
MALRHPLRRLFCGCSEWAAAHATIERLPTLGRGSIDSSAVITAAGRIVERKGKVSFRAAEFCLGAQNFRIRCVLAKPEDYGALGRDCCKAAASALAKRSPPRRMRFQGDEGRFRTTRGSQRSAAAGREY